MKEFHRFGEQLFGRERRVDGARVGRRVQSAPYRLDPLHRTPGIGGIAWILQIGSQPRTAFLPFLDRHFIPSGRNWSISSLVARRPCGSPALWLAGESSHLI